MILDSSLWIWIPLLFAVIFSFQKQLRPAFALLALSLVGGWFTDRLSLMALLYVAIGLCGAYYIPQLKGRWKWFAHGALLLWAIALLLHAIPGFNNPKVLDNVVAGANSAPFRLYLNLDKPVVFFALLLAWPPLLGNHQTIRWAAIGKVSIPLFALLFVAWALGAIKPELSLPTWWWLFALNNLLLTCVVEEAFFRGYLQKAVSEKFGLWLGIALASTLFGLAHFSGGVTLVLFATLAGIGYGAIYHLSGRLWTAVLFHFLFNFSHLIFFTYPVWVQR